MGVLRREPLGLVKPRTALACLSLAALILVPARGFGQTPPVGPTPAPSPPTFGPTPPPPPPIGQPPVAGQAPAARLEGPRRFFVVPSLSIAGVYDDNLFGTATQPESVWLSRFSPRLQLLMRPEPELSISADYSFAAEVFPEAPEENRLLANQHAELTLVSTPGTDTTFTVGGEYGRTHTPRDLILGTGLEFDREVAENFVGNARLEHRVGPADVLGLDYRFSRLDFETERPADSHAWGAGWIHRIGRRGSLSLRGGVQRLEGEFRPLYGAAVAREFKRGSLGASYSRDSYAIPGEGRVDTDAFAVNLERRLGRAARLTISPGVSLNKGDDLDVTVYRINLQLACPVGRWLTIRGSYDGNFQRSMLNGLGDASGGDLDHNVAGVDFTISRPTRPR